jgi:glycine cleavage system H protein
VGWLYSVRGTPEVESLDVHGYIEYLDSTIRRMAEEGHGEEGAGDVEL